MYPDWVVEILSPAQQATRVISNILYSIKYASKLGWLIDPEARIILVFMPGQEPMEFTAKDNLPVPEFLRLSLSVEQIFGWLKV